jgi:hypothetical protein
MNENFKTIKLIWFLSCKKGVGISRGGTRTVLQQVFPYTTLHELSIHITKCLRGECHKLPGNAPSWVSALSNECLLLAPPACT